jgi:hypothetical protein
LDFRRRYPLLRRSIGKKTTKTKGEINQQLKEEMAAGTGVGGMIRAAEMAKVAKEYENLTEIFDLTIEHLAHETRALPPPREIDSDWLTKFRKLAADFSATDAQYGFARISRGRDRTARKLFSAYATQVQPLEH